MTVVSLLPNDPNDKRCSRCGQVLPLDGFYRNSSRKDGVGSSCKGCAKASMKAYSETHREEIKARMKAYYEAHREGLKARAKAYNEAHREEANARTKAYREAHQEKVKAQMKVYHETHRERAKAARHRRRAQKRGNGGAYTAEQLRQLLAKQRQTCVYCRAKLRPRYHIDHIIPPVSGGSNDITNIQLFCPRCNLAKGAKHPVDFAKKHGMLL